MNMNIENIRKSEGWLKENLTAIDNAVVLLNAYGFNSAKEYKLESLREQNAGLMKARDEVLAMTRQLWLKNHKNLWMVESHFVELKTFRSKQDFDNQVETLLANIEALKVNLTKQGE